ncbi:hypothetical protein [Bordetella trematum]|uniref:hypothetical protein n=1 Tax=Bordetella trematum TaxID=123899 RepID=UPI003988E50F
MKIETTESGAYYEIGGEGVFGARRVDDWRFWIAWSERCSTEVEVVNGVIDDFGTLVCVYRHHMK